jgi:integrase
MEFDPLTGRELRSLRRHQRESAKSPFDICLGARGAAFSTRLRPYGRADSCCGKVGDKGPCPYASPCLCGYKLANDGHDTPALQAYLGHRNIQNTTRCTALAQDRFKGFWRD